MTPTSRFVIYVIATSLLYLSLASAASFVPDTTGLYDRPGEPKYVVEYYTKYVKPEDATSTLVRKRERIFFLGRGDFVPFPLLLPYLTSIFQISLFLLPLR
jgi:hypothetical protein